MVQKFTAIGNIGKPPEVRTLEDGTKVAKTTMAVTESYKNKDGQKVENTTWLNLVFWRGLAGVVEQYVKKGDLIFIEGKLQNREYEKDGQKKYFTEIVCNEMKMLGGRKNESDSPAPQGGEKSNSGTENSSDGQNPDNLPF